MKNYKVEDVECYKTSKGLAHKVYLIVRRWDYFDQKTSGTQIVRSIDSIAANIAEGFGRFHKKDKIKFFYNARASTYETKHWLDTAYKRRLIANQEFDEIIAEINKLPKQINYLIKMTQNNLSMSYELYGADFPHFGQEIVPFVISASTCRLQNGHVQQSVFSVSAFVRLSIESITEKGLNTPSS